MENLTGNAVYGMDRTTVIILNDDVFPQGVEDLEDQVAIIKGFVQHNYNDLKKPFWMGMLYKCYPGVQFIWGQLILMDLMRLFKIEVGFTDDTTDDARQTAYEKSGSGYSPQGFKLPPGPSLGTTTSGALSLGKMAGTEMLMIRAGYFLINFALGHYFNYKFRCLKLGGKATLDLRTQMINQILQLTPGAQEEFPTGKTAKIMGSQIENALSTTWANVFGLWQSLFQLFIMIGFAWYLVASNAAFIGCTKRETDDPCGEGVYRFLTFIPILFIAIPVIMILFDGVMLKLNIRRSTELNIAAMEKADDWSTFVIEAGDLKSLVQTYRQDYQVAMEFKGLHKQFNGANFKANMFEQGTLWKAKWFPLILAAGVMIIAGMEVFNGMAIGTFLALFNTANNFGNVIAGIFASLFAMGEGYASIKKIAMLLNADTMRKERHLHAEELAKRIKDFEAVNGPLDPGMLTVHGIGYKYNDDGSRTHHPVLPDNLNFTVEPGQMVALTGSSASGKATLLSLIAGTFIPTKGFSYRPSNWRVRFADGVPLLYDATLMYNLRFGEFVEHPEKEIWALCAKLGLSHDLLGDAEFDVGFMGEKIPYSDRVVVQIARILLSSVDLVLLAGSLDGIGERHMERVIKVLHELIDNRGLPCLESEIGESPLALRKVKTVIISSKLHHVVDLADSVLDMS